MNFAASPVIVRNFSQIYLGVRPDFCWPDFCQNLHREHVAPIGPVPAKWAIPATVFETFARAIEQASVKLSWRENFDMALALRAWPAGLRSKWERLYCCCWIALDPLANANRSGGFFYSASSRSEAASRSAIRSRIC
jgi:hypothetical protein